MFKKTVVMLLVIICSAKFSISQNISKTHWGIETELLSWRIGKIPKSFYIGGWYGIKHFKLSLAGGYFDIRKNHLPEQFISDKTMVLNLKCDYFFNEDFKHFWIGPSLIFERSQLISEKYYHSKLKYAMIGFSTGYLFCIKDRVDIGPSLQIHTPIGRYQYVVGPQETWTVPWSFEPGIRVGVKF